MKTKIVRQIIAEKITEEKVINEFHCLVCGSIKVLPPDHPANERAEKGIVYRASCEKCRKNQNN